MSDELRTVVKAQLYTAPPIELQPCPDPSAHNLHCPVGCDSGACETCPCCGAGWCVYGIDGLPEDPDDFAQWLEVAADHNPLAARFQALLRSDHGIAS